MTSCPQYSFSQSDITSSIAEKYQFILGGCPNTSRIKCFINWVMSIAFIGSWYVPAQALSLTTETARGPEAASKAVCDEVRIQQRSYELLLRKRHSTHRAKRVIELASSRTYTTHGYVTVTCINPTIAHTLHGMFGIWTD